MNKNIYKQNNIVKKAGPEDSGITDPRTGLPIYVTTTVRKKYRKYFTQEMADRLGRDVYTGLRNSELNQIIAQDFAASANDVRHHFLSRSSDLASGRKDWIEIRRAYSRRAFHFFLSAIYSEKIVIIGTTTKYYKPTRPRMIDPKAFR